MFEFTDVQFLALAVLPDERGGKKVQLTGISLKRRNENKAKMKLMLFPNRITCSREENSAQLKEDQNKTGADLFANSFLKSSYNDCSMILFCVKRSV